MDEMTKEGTIGGNTVSRLGTSGRRVTRQMVADAAGVSVTTVTHALNPPPGARVRTSTRERVQKAAEELGYRPSFVGRALVSGRTYTVGLLQPHHQSILYPFYQHIVYGMAEAMELDEYHMLILFRSPDSRWQRTVNQGRVDGMFVLQSDRGTGDIEAACASGVPVVVVNRCLDSASAMGASCVCSDHVAMMSSAILDFVSRGCTRILALHDYRECDANARMLGAFSEECARRAGAGIVGSTMVPAADYSAQLRSIFRGRVHWDGIFVDGLGRAQHVQRVAALEGLLPGRDFTLICCDTHSGTLSADPLPGNVVYFQQPELVGSQAWQMLKERLKGETGHSMACVPYRREVVLE